MSQSSNDQAGDSSGPVTLHESDYHRLLSSARRRTVIEVLEGVSVPVSVEDLANVIAIRGDDVDRDRVDDVERIAIALHHVHLPKLSARGVLDYDPASHEVESYRGITR